MVNIICVPGWLVRVRSVLPLSSSNGFLIVFLMFNLFSVRG